MNGVGFSILSKKEPNQGSNVGLYQSREDASRSVLVTNCPPAGGELAPFEAFVSSRDEAERGASGRTRDGNKWKAGGLPRPNCQTRAGIFVLWSVRRRTKEAAAAAAQGTDYQCSWRHREPLDVLSHPLIKLSARHLAFSLLHCTSTCPSTTLHLRLIPARRNGCPSILLRPSGLTSHQRTKMMVPAKSLSVFSTTHAIHRQWTCSERSTLERSCLLGR